MRSTPQRLLNINNVTGIIVQEPGGLDIYFDRLQTPSDLGPPQGHKQLLHILLYSYTTCPQII